ncbi:UNVERIFIED_CONTAM: hypothetical protein NCL1_30434 [Trichonephila clavipes]
MFTNLKMSDKEREKDNITASLQIFPVYQLFEKSHSFINHMKKISITYVSRPMCQMPVNTPADNFYRSFSLESGKRLITFLHFSYNFCLSNTMSIVSTPENDTR